MGKKTGRLVRYTLLSSIAVLLLFVFVPRRYDVPHMQERPGTLFWSLRTGSRIGYTLVPGKGKKQPCPVIFLQGGPGGAVSGRIIRILSPLSEYGYDVYFYDQAGSGHSARLKNIEEYSVSRHLRDLEEITGKTGAGKVILIGQSWGAILAALFVAGHPGKVAKLIVTCPGPVIPVRQDLAKVKAPDSLNLGEPQYTNHQANEKTRTLRSRVVAWWAVTFGSKLASDEEADGFQTLLDNELNKSTVCDTAKALKATGGSGFYAALMTVNSFDRVSDPRPLLKQSGIPVLVMKGQCDNQKWGFTAEYLELFRNNRLVVIPGAGHSISVEQPGLYFSTIRDFLTGND